MDNLPILIQNENKYIPVTYGDGIVYWIGKRGLSVKTIAQSQKKLDNIPVIDIKNNPKKIIVDNNFLILKTIS